MPNIDQIIAMEEGKAGPPVGGSERDPEKSPTSNTLVSDSTGFTKTSRENSHKDSRGGEYSSPLNFLSLAAHKLYEAVKPEEKTDRIVVRSLDEFPRGYPNVATFLDSDDSFMIYRRFGYLQSRLLLDKQDELRLLEEKLDIMERQAQATDEWALTSRDASDVAAQPRKDLMDRIRTAFCEYSSLLKAAQDLVALNRPAACDYKSLENYMWNRAPVCEAESSWIFRKEDLVSLRTGREHTWLDSAVEKLLQLLHCSVIEWIFCSKQTKKKSPNGDEVYYTRSRIEQLVNVIILSIILVLLVVPVYVLYRLVSGAGAEKSNATCIGVLFASTLAFSAALSLFTRAKRHEILAAAAGYCAVLVVFLGNVSSLSKP